MLNTRFRNFGFEFNIFYGILSMDINYFIHIKYFSKIDQYSSMYLSPTIMVLIYDK